MTKLQSQWLEQASHDLKHSLLILEHGVDEIDVNTAAYLCQQAAEKLVKSLYVREKLEIPKSHDVASLIRRLEDGGVGTEAVSGLLICDARFQDWAEKTRYITDYYAGRKSVEGAQAIVAKCLDAVRNQEESFDDANSVQEAVVAYLAQKAARGSGANGA